MTKYQNFDLEVQTTGDVEVVIDEDEIQTVIGNYISRKIPGDQKGAIGVTVRKRG